MFAVACGVVGSAAVAGPTRLADKRVRGGPFCQSRVRARRASAAWAPRLRILRSSGARSGEGLTLSLAERNQRAAPKRANRAERQHRARSDTPAAAPCAGGLAHGLPR